MHCEIHFHFIISVPSAVVLKSRAKAFLMEYKGELKSLFQLFYCIYVLFKTLVENCNIDVPKVKLQQKDKKKASSF